MFGWAGELLYVCIFGLECHDSKISVSVKVLFLYKVLLRNMEHCMMTLISQWKNKHKPVATTVHVLLQKVNGRVHL